MFGTLGALLAMLILCPLLAFNSCARVTRPKMRYRRPYRWHVQRRLRITFFKKARVIPGRLYVI